MKALRVVLIIVGLVTLIPSVIGLFLPWEKLVCIWGAFGIEVARETEGSLLVYMTRAFFATLAWAGVLFLLAATDVNKYLALIRSLALASVCVGLTCILVGVNIGIPSMAYLGDGIFCLVAGGLIWTLSSPINCKCGQTEPSNKADVD
ncbi:MAG: hypothetical protein GWP14_10500 [Actinobacteria bacterium]|nr:hypothetical protein [Actinomycetota bacterium]